MERLELLTVVDRFQLSYGLVLVPDFSVPNGGWRNCQEEVHILTPAGDEYGAIAQFNMTHFNFRDPKVPMDRRWRVVVCLQGIEKERLPVGSRLFVSEQIRNALLPNVEA